MAQKCRVSQELASGGELFSKVADEGQLPMDLARKYFAQVLAGAAHCHNHGVAHRDLKLENVSPQKESPQIGSFPRLPPFRRRLFLSACAPFDWLVR
jgi:serine/threonine protein kinase